MELYDPKIQNVPLKNLNDFKIKPKVTHYQTEDEDDINVVFLAGINPNRELERSDLEVTWSSDDRRIQHFNIKIDVPWQKY